MLTAVPAKIFVAVAPVDLRRGLDGLCALIQHGLALNPFDGAWYLFRNKAGTRLKLVVFDGTGFWLCSRRLERGRWVWPQPGDAAQLCPMPGADSRGRLAPGGTPRGNPPKPDLTRSAAMVK